MRRVDDLHVLNMTPLIPPRTLKERLPIDETATNTVVEARETIKRILRREDPRLLLVVGPCSIHDTSSAIEYAERLYQPTVSFRIGCLL